MHGTTKPVHVLGPEAGYSDFLLVFRQYLLADAVLIPSDKS